MWVYSTRFVWLMEIVAVVKVLIVDDSAFMRKALTTFLSTDAAIEVVGTARDGQDALQKVMELNPDVITLDIEMPKMDGLAALQQIMKTKPTPVIMISSLTEEGAESTLKALEYGALDFFPKSLSTQQAVFTEELTKKVKVLARKKALMQLRFGRQQTGTRLTASTSVQAQVKSAPCRGARDIVAIGVSTGGPPAVQKLLSSFPSDFPACILIAQHMPAAFTGSFAKRLDGASNIGVSEAKNGDRVKAGHAYIAPGGQHIVLRTRGALPEIGVTGEPASALYKPSATTLMESVAQYGARKSLGVILTGMGSDGLEGVRLLRERGGYILAQNEASCVVYGMPKSIVDANLADQIVSLDQMADAIMTAVKG